MDRSQIRIIAVDDEPFILNMTSRVLKSLGCTHIDTETNGKRALERLNTPESYDLVICDLNMPEMDGVEFIRRTTEFSFSGCIILLSGEDQRMLNSTLDLAQAYKLNILGAIQKPIDRMLLGEMLDRLGSACASQSNYGTVEAISEDELRAAIDNDFAQALTIYYQPKVSVSTGKIVGMEALARWSHPDRGILSPGAFIPLAEQCGLIDELSLGIFRQALKQTRLWKDMGFDLKCSINFSINSFSSEAFNQAILNALKESGLSPENITLEITETQVMEDALNCLEVIMRLRLKKFGLSIDDFGTGNSSMVQLQKIPFNELKLDQAFVHGASGNSSSRAILESSVSLARKLGMSIVAEGVENREDWNIIESLECDLVQGFYCSKPLDAEAFTELLKNWQGPHPLIQ